MQEEADKTLVNLFDNKAKAKANLYGRGTKISPAKELMSYENYMREYGYVESSNIHYDINDNYSDKYMDDIYNLLSNLLCTNLQYSHIYLFFDDCYFYFRYEEIVELDEKYDPLIVIEKKEPWIYADN